MKDKELPFVSIVVCTYNRGNALRECLESVIHQTYPRDRYEVIVVDDHSRDDTAKVARSYSNIQVISHKINKGPSAARNTAIDAAKGEIIACIDDDAVANPDWLNSLVEPFHTPEVTATGGRVFAYKTDSLAERYLSAIGSGNPAPITFGKSKNPLWRFWAYIKSMFSPIEISTVPVAVQAIFTLNCAYRTAAIRAIGGFDTTLRYDEDTDVSTRLRKNGAHLIFIPTAIVYHRHRESLHALMRQTYRNAINTLNYYAKEKKSLPIFPFPLLYFVISIGFIIIQPVVGFLFILIGPLVLYSWWLIRAFRSRRIEYLLYAYIQLTIELTSILGLIDAKGKGMARGLHDRISEFTTVSKRDIKYLGRFFADKPLVLYSGWVGYGNLGDELLFFAHEKLFPDYHFIPYHRMSFLRFFIALKRKKIKACFLGGGTLIDLPGTWLTDTQNMLAMDLPVFSIGTGVNFNLSEDGKRPIANDSFQEWVEPLNRFRYLGVRGPLSAEILNARLAKKIEVVGDTALALAPDTYLVPAKNISIGICIAYSNEVSSSFSEEGYRAIFLAFIKNKITQGFEVVLLPVQPKDIAFNEKLREEVNDTRCRIFAFHDVYEEYFLEVEKCALFIGQKLHSTITATMLRVPSIMLSYHPKCVDYMSSIGMEDQIISMKALSAPSLEEKIQHTLAHAAEIRSHLDSTIQKYSDLQKKRAQYITTLI